MTMCMNCGCRSHPGITCEHALDKLEIDRLRHTLKSIEECGTKNSGYGHTCAKIAAAALRPSAVQTVRG